MITLSIPFTTPRHKGRSFPPLTSGLWFVTSPRARRIMFPPLAPGTPLRYDENGFIVAGGVTPENAIGVIVRQGPAMTGRRSMEITVR